MIEQDGTPEDYYGLNVAHFFYGDSSRQTVLGMSMREGKTITKEVELAGRKGGKRMIVYYKAMLAALAKHDQQSTETPWRDLPDEFKKRLLAGTGSDEVEFTFSKAGKASKVLRPFEGIIPSLERLHAETNSEFTRNRLFCC